MDGDNMFSITSRYFGIETAEVAIADRKTRKFVRRRFISPMEQFALVREHVVVSGDRLDNLAARYLGDPEQFWRICDANNVIDPNELTRKIGARIRITLPDGVSGAPHA